MGGTGRWCLRERTDVTQRLQQRQRERGGRTDDDCVRQLMHMITHVYTCT